MIFLLFYFDWCLNNVRVISGDIVLVKLWFIIIKFIGLLELLVIFWRVFIIRVLLLFLVLLNNLFKVFVNFVDIDGLVVDWKFGGLF